MGCSGAVASRRADQQQPSRQGAGRRRSLAAAAHVVGADLRARAAWVLLLAAVVAVVVGLSVAGMVGARRTATVLDRFVDETRTGDVVVAALAPDVARDPAAGEALSGALAGVEGVEAVGVQAGFPVEVGVDDYFMVWSSVDDTALRAIDRPLVVDGRLPAADDPDEIAINEQAAEVLDLRLGDTVEGPTLTPEGAAAAFTGEFEGFIGDPLGLEVVGIVRQGPDLSGRSTISGIAAVASPAFARVHGANAGSYLTQVHIRTDDPSPALLRRLTAVAREEVGPFELRVETVDTLWRLDAAETYRTLAGLVAVFTLTLGIAAVIVVAQALNRDRFVAGRHDSVLSGIGMTRRGRSVVAAAPGLLALAAGGLVGLGAGMVASAAFPLGRAGDAEVAPGMRPDPAVALAAAAVVVGGLALWLLVATWRSTRAGAERPARPSLVAERLARAGARPPLSVGVRMAFERGAGRVSLPVRSVVVGTAVAVAAATAVLVVARSADAVAAEPDRYGWVWSTVPDDLSGDDPEANAERAAGLDGVDSVAGLFFSTVLVDDEQRPAAALEVLSGDLAFGVVEGRLPATEAEAALSPSMAGDLDVGVGDQFEAAGAQGGPPQQLTVVGLVLPPPVDDVPRGVVLTPDGLTATAQSEPAVYVAIDYDDRADVAAVESSLEELGYRFTPSTRPAAPSRVEQLRSVQPLLERLVLLLGVLGAIGLLHFLGLSVRRRAHDLAVLKALGFVHGQVRRAVVAQAVAVTLVGVAVGIPAGFVLGRLLWLGSVAALDILDDPASPVGAALGGGVLVVMAAGLLAVGPGIVAARRRASGVLRSE